MSYLQNKGKYQESYNRLLKFSNICANFCYNNQVQFFKAANLMYTLYYEKDVYFNNFVKVYITQFRIHDRYKKYFGIYGEGYVIQKGYDKYMDLIIRVLCKDLNCKLIENSINVKIDDSEDVIMNNTTPVFDKAIFEFNTYAVLKGFV